MSAQEVLTQKQYREYKEYELYFTLIEGRSDVKGKLMLILNPDIPLTTSFLTKGQGHFSAIAHFMAEKFPIFTGLRDFADKIALASHGVEGKGIDASVRLTGAVVESKLLQRLGINIKEREVKE